MKKIFTLYLISCFFIVGVQAQFVAIDAEFKTFLQSKYPSCFNAAGLMDTTCTAITTEDTLIFHGLTTTLFGIQYFDNLIYLDCSGNNINTGGIAPAEFPASGFHFPATLLYLDCSNISGGSSGIDVPFALPDGLQHLDYSSNRAMSCLYSPGLKYINCSNNKLSNLYWGNASPDTIICRNQTDDFIGHHTTLVSLGELPASLRYLDCGDNGLQSLGDLPAGLTWLDCSHNYYHSLITFEDLPTLYALPELPASLKYIDCSNNSISVMPGLPALLSWLDVSINPLRCLPVIPESLQHLNVNSTSIQCILNSVPAIAFPVCNGANDIYGCGSMAIVNAGPSISDLVTFLGQPSPSVPYNLSAFALTPASGNITVTATSEVEVSLDNVHFTNSPLSIPYTMGNLLPMTIYARINTAAISGTISGVITNSGGGASDAIVGVSGSVTNVIPVKLSSFTAKKDNKIARLAWITEQEINSKEFIVERSIHETVWEELQRVAAAGNSNLMNKYYSIDYNPARGINYYRLKQIGLNGRIDYSEIRVVYFGNDVNIVLAPNPAKENTTIYLPGNVSPVSINIFNQNGQQLKSVSSNGDMIKINLAGLSKGIYSIKITGKNINEVRKLVVN